MSCTNRAKRVDRHRRPSAGRAAFFAAVVATGRAWAVINGTNAANDTGFDSSNNPVTGWTYAAQADGASAVYLGNGWGICTAHQGNPTDIVLNGVTYNTDASSFVNLTDPNASNAPADIMLFKILPTAGQLPQQAPISLSTSLPTAGTPFTAIGAGFTGGTRQYWTVNESTTPWTWGSPSASPTGATFGSVPWGNSHGALHWGKDTTAVYAPNGNAAVQYQVSAGNTYTVTAFLWYFYSEVVNPTPSANEAVLSGFDSGGGVFTTDNNGGTKLLGILDAVFHDQTWDPDHPENIPGSNAFFGDFSAATNISSLATQIASTVGFKEWTTNGSGNWLSGTRWNQYQTMVGGGSPGSNGPNGSGAIANLLGTPTAATVITLDGAATVGTINFSNSNGYTISGANTLTFNNSGSAALIADWKGSHAISVPVVLADNLIVNVADAAGVVTMSGAISGSHSLTKIGSGTLRLSATNSYSGGTTIGTGVIQFDNIGAMGAAGSVTVNSGGVAAAGYAIDQAFLSHVASGSAGVVALAANSSNNLDFSAGGANFTAARLGATGNFTYTGTLTPNAGTYRLGGGGGTLTLPNANALSGATNLDVGLNGTANGTVVLGASNGFTGTTTIGGGTLSISADNQMGMAPGAAADNLFISGGTLAASATFALNGNRNIVLGPSSGSGAGSFWVAGGQTLTISSALKNNGAGTGGLTKSGSGTLLLTGASATYSGATTIQSGTLQINGANAIGDASAVLFANTAGANLALLSAGETVGSLAGGGATGGNVQLGSGTLTIGGDNTSTSYAGAITGSGGLTKTGTGTQTLSGANTYTGNTQITGASQALESVIIAAASNSVGAGPSTIQLNNGMIEVVGGLTIDRAISTQNYAAIRLAGFSGTVTYSGMVTLGGGSYNEPGAPSGTTLVFNGPVQSPGNAFIHRVGGTVIFNGAMTLGPSTFMTANDGTTIFNVDAGGAAGAQNFGIDGSNIIFNTSQHLLGLTVEGPISLTQNGSRVLTTSTLAFTGGPTAPQSTVDLADNDMHVGTGVITDYRSLISAAYNGGTWTGNGITSSVAKVTAHVGLGYVSGADYLTMHPGGTFDGQTVGMSDVLVKYTYQGDASLDGKIGLDDYALIDAGFFFGAGSPTWVNGDFNYDGVVNWQDYAMIDSAFAAQGSPLASEMIADHEAMFGAQYLAAVTALSVPVPEPATMAVLAPAALILLRRRRHISLIAKDN